MSLHYHDLGWPLIFIILSMNNSLMCLIPHYIEHLLYIYIYIYIYQTHNYSGSVLYKGRKCAFQLSSQVLKIPAYNNLNLKLPNSLKF